MIICYGYIVGITFTTLAGLSCLILQQNGGKLTNITLWQLYYIYWKLRYHGNILIPLGFYLNYNNHLCKHCQKENHSQNCSLTPTHQQKTIFPWFEKSKCNIQEVNAHSPSTEIHRGKKKSPNEKLQDCLHS